MSTPVIGQSIGGALTTKQREALKSLYVRAGDPPDLYDYITSGTLAWHNRERVLDALKRRGLLNEDGTLTDKGVSLAEQLMDVTPENGYHNGEQS